ncbi:MAG: LysR family transcriptional regulator [Pseudomonadota bacterium]|jgi:DNA-binding transcriptional LysR family regulator|nr:LysR family transcriptional regulator [Xanthomonadaceae bacterium]MDE2249741.1 LysR family transcriptional regulator [Xanthomonadaceae bacterium]MDE3210183.1 LysR family transcriptional regulator [Pseudomonadota bacterium]
MNRPDLRMDLNLFRVLEAIHTQGGISAAARSLHLTQPAITHALNRLRELFGDPLFVRQGNRVIPTDTTRTVIAEVQLHLKGLQATTRMQPAFHAAALEQQFSLGLRDVLESIAFPPLLSRLSELAPGVRLASRRLAGGEVERELSAGSIDLVIDRRLAGGQRLSAEHLLDESLVVVMRRGHRLAAGTLRKADYLAARHVAVSQLGEAVPLDVLLTQDGRPRQIQLLCQTYFSACQVAAGSDLLLTMPRSYAASFSRLLPLATQALPIKLKPIPILAYWHPSREHDRAHAWFRRLLIDTIRRAPEFGTR